MSEVRNEYAEFLGAVPDRWSKVKMRDVGRIVSGGTPSRDAPSLWGGGIPWVTPGELTALPTKEIEKTAETISAAGLAGSGANLLPVNSLLITSRATLGARAVNTVPMATNQGFKSVVPFDRRLTDYLYHLTEKIKLEMVRRASGTTFLEISGSEFGDIVLPVPQADEATRIAEVLDTLDAAIRGTEAVVAKLRAMKQGLLHDLLTRGIDANGDLRPPQPEAPHLYHQTPLGWLPKEWDMATVGKTISEPTRNGLYKSASHHGRGPLMVQMGCLFSDEAVDFSGATRVSVSPIEINQFGLKNGDLLIARRSLVFEGAGLCAIVRHLPEPSTFESSIIRLRLRQSAVLPDYAALFFRGVASSRQRRTLIRQVAVSGVSSADVKALFIALPSLREQAEAIERYVAVNQKIDEEIALLDKLRLQKSGLMDDLLTGRVPVTPLL
jgi:type I restriction enzyme S subunit